ncbi:DUF262 domain-containing protein [Bacillus sp. AFS088145]|uniref:DUF262 domain-containing protein n=1 Tax=Bacillus sp. AFS088145 TaxID=2033514 RepID=UPI000BF3CACC|nr:DUF262 domain-containing protein [Bacillus sp. AFS088145]PFH86470.1 hypothetical protein COI44_12690 [Bacillus sp. AFS088145]
MATKNFSDISTWTVEDLMDSIEENPQKKEKVIIPKYQRNLVWSDKQKKSFIDSIKSGFPFGSLLLFKEGSEGGITNYSLIDGLQRTTTIKKYIEEPTKFFENENIDEELINNVLNILKLDINRREELLRVITDWVRQLKGFKESHGYSSFNLGNEICSKFNLPTHRDDFNRLINVLVPFKERIEAEADISLAKIPVIIYSGQESNLPSIFERINSRGTQLNKYQIYAATWSRSKIKINNTEIIDHIKAKYDALIEEGLQVDNYDPNSKEFYKSDFTVFEYIFGLGKHLSKHYPYLFGLSEQEDTTESIGFNLCTMCLRDDLKEMPLIVESIVILDQEKFLNALIDSVKLIHSTLKPFITLKANRKTKQKSEKLVIYHTEYQIVSMIAKVFKSKYDSNLEIKSSWSSKEKPLMKNIPYHYLYDIIREYWRGSGDSKIKELVQEGSRYEKELYQENWANILNEWFSYQLDRKEKSRVNIRDVDILFLKYIYAHIMTSYEDLSNLEYEIEHIVPIARLKTIINGEGIPMSAISNLCFIEKEINRDKKELTIYEFFENQVNDGQLTEEQASVEIKKIEKFSFTTKDDLEFVEKINVDDYLNLLKARFEVLKDKFYEVNKIEPSNE